MISPTSSLSAWLLIRSCSSVTCRSWKGQNTGGALAVTRGLVGEVEGLAGGEISPALYMVKNALQQSKWECVNLKSDANRFNDRFLWKDELSARNNRRTEDSAGRTESMRFDTRSWDDREVLRQVGAEDANHWRVEQLLGWFQICMFGAKQLTGSVTNTI